MSSGPRFATPKLWGRLVGSWIDLQSSKSSVWGPAIARETCQNTDRYLTSKPCSAASICVFAK